MCEAEQCYAPAIHASEQHEKESYGSNFAQGQRKTMKNLFHHSTKKNEENIVKQIKKDVVA